MNDNRDLLEKLNSDNQKKQDFIASLKEQIRQKEMLRRKNQQMEDEEDRNRPNYIFDDYEN